jgi:hypothetical protein
MDNDQGDRPDGAPSEPTRKKCSAAPTLFVTDAELIRRTGVPEKVAREKHRGFPQKQKLWGNRRYWPAVKQWFDRTNGIGSGRPRE